MADPIAPEHQTDPPSPEQQDVNAASEPLVEQDSPHHSNSENHSDSDIPYNSDNSLPAQPRPQNADMRYQSQSPLQPRSCSFPQENRPPIAVPPLQPHLSAASQQQRLPAPAHPQMLAQRQGQPRNSNRGYGTPYDYEEAVPLVEPRVLDNNIAYNAVDNAVTTVIQPANSGVYAIPNAPVGHQNPRQQQLRHRQNQSGQGGQARQEPVHYYLPIIESQQNNRFTLNMKRYIFTCLGVPGIPNMHPKVQKFCTLFSVILYICLFSWGMVTITVSALGMGEYTDERRIVFVPSLLCGLYFIFLGFYWMIVFWWNHVTRGRSTTITFSFLTTLWVVLCMYLVGVTSALLTELYEHRYFLNFKSPNGDEDIRMFYKLIPILSFLSMAIIWCFYVFIFIVNVIFSYFTRTN